ncbi:FAD-binding oxidoreductase [Labrenzia sp. OB1]|uniref:FAD-binding oxidoreductase n=1 Tax=Labrenzia sp. OB1 TaxID=1561204 RepID=UPI000AB81301|nr:FAD-binding oxidoreductase [Labrenzia sp. OB1]
MRLKGNTRRQILKWVSASLLSIPVSKALSFSVAKAAQENEPIVPFNLRFKSDERERIFVEKESDLIRFAKRLKLGKTSFSIQSSGHCFAGLSQNQNIVVDTRKLNKIVFDEKRQRLTVGPGTRIGTVNAVTSNYGMALPAGYCQTVAMGGHVCGGGIGILSRSFGLTCDQLLQVKIMTADGSFAVANNETNSDLFWALRGGGASNFGIVTELVLQTHRVSDLTVVRLSGRHQPHQLAQWISAWQKVALRSPKELGFQLYCSNVDGENIEILARIISNGAKNLAVDAERMVSKIAGLSVSYSSTYTGSFLEVADMLWPRDYVGSDYLDIRSDFLAHALSPTEWYDILISMVKDWRKRVSFSMEALGGNIDRISNEETAFAHRTTAKFILQYTSRLRQDEPNTARIQAVKRLQSSFTPYTTGGAYYNYPERDRANGLTAYWGDNLPRLTQIKKKYDPENAFNHALSIPVGK